MTALWKKKKELIKIIRLNTKKKLNAEYDQFDIQARGRVFRDNYMERITLPLEHDLMNHSLIELEEMVMRDI
jgi:hypothetical protein